MGPESLALKIEKLITKVLKERHSLPMVERPMPEEELVRVVVREFGDGDISNTIEGVIYYMEHTKHILIRDLRGRLELNERIVR